MSIKIRIWIPKYYYGDAINGRPRAVEFFPGYTTLIGPNGSGKTTYLRQIQEFCRKHEYECLYFGATDDTALISLYQLPALLARVMLS